MEDNFDDPFEALQGLFNNLIYNAPSQLRIYMNNGQRDHVHISAPLFLVKRLQEAMIRKYCFSPGDDFVFMGIKIIPSSDYALTLFHEEYPIYKEDWMVHKISLDPLFVNKTGRDVTKYVAQIKGFIPARIRKDSSLN